MYTKLFHITLAGLLAWPLGAFADNHRWYGSSLVERGETLYEANCVACHQAAGAGVDNWQQRNADGTYPAPPLNGTAHTWHHDLAVLQRQIREGGEKLGGSMPAFAGTLSENEIAAVIAYVQSLWPDEVYATWARNYPRDAERGITVSNAKGSDDNPVTARLKSMLSPGTTIGEPEPTPIDGIYSVRAGPRFLYVDETGRYVFTGELMDIETRQSLTEQLMGTIRLEALSTFPAEDMVVFPAEGEEKASLRIFTDTTCPYCRRLHREVPDLQAAGVTVRYVPFPRSGPEGQGYDEMRSVWCEDDRAAAMTEAKSDEGYVIGDTDCDAASVVAKGYELGVEIGVGGTPAIVLPDGRMIPGYQPYPNLLRALGVTP